MPQRQAQGETQRQGPLRQEAQQTQAPQSRLEAGGWQMSAARRSIALVLLVLGTFVLGAGSAAAAEFEKYELESVSVELSSTQAGAHADFTTAFALSENGAQEPYAQTRDVEVQLPPGMIGNPQVFPRCSVAQLGNVPEESECPV